MTSRPLTEVEITQIVKMLHNDRDRCLFILGVKTGFRISELLSLKVSDVTDKLGLSQTMICDINDSITVSRKDMKGKRQSRTVPLHKEAKAYLITYIKTLPVQYEKQHRLFPISRIQAYRIIRNAALSCNIRGVVSTHSMRKTFGQAVYTRTNNIVAAQRALGHASLSSTTHYLSVGQDEVDEAILA